MSALVLFHVIFSGEGFVAGGAVDVLFARVLFAVAGGVTGGGEGVGAGEACGVRTGIFLFRRWGFVGGGCGVGGGRDGGFRLGLDGGCRGRG